MRSNMRAAIASFFILMSVVLFFGIITKVVAATSPFPGFLSTAATEITTGVFKFSPITVHHEDDKSFIIDVTTVLGQAPTDTGGVIGKLDSAEDNLGSWDEVLDQDRLENSTSEGIFLLVGTSQTNLNGTSFPIATGDFTYNVDPLLVPNGGTNITIPPKQGNAFIFSEGKTTATNIGAYFWRLDAPNRFFDKTTVTAAPIRVSGLTPDTDYYVQLALKEDVATGTHQVALSQPIKIHTMTTAAAAANGIDLTNEATTNYTNTISDVNASQGNKTIAEKLYCWKTLPDDYFPTLNISGCVAELFNNLLVPVAVRINSMAGTLFDSFAAISVGSTIYGQGTTGAGIASFVEGSWSIVRDIANIFFIFILLYAALGLVLSMHHVDTKKLVAQVIIVALIINFSLFFCRVTIDASNVLSRVFYNAMNVSSKGNTPAVTSATGVAPQPISGAIIEGVQPQRILSEESLKKSDLGQGSILIVLLMSFVLNLLMAWIFFMSAAFFAGRIGVIWFSMIFAPLAFVSSIVPGLDKNLKQLGWSNWLSGFMKACFNAPIFFFFLYLIINLVGGGPEGNLGKTIIAVTNSANNSWVAFIIGILLPTMILVGLMMAAKKIAEDMAGEFGGAFAGIVAAGTGMAAMAVTGGAAAVGSRFIGGAASNVANNDRLKDMASGKVKNADGTMRDATKFEKWSAQQKLKAANTLKSSSFDVRQTGVGNALSKVSNVNMNTGSGLLKGAVGAASLGGIKMDLSTGARAGGYDASVDRKTEENKKKEKMFATGYDKEKYAAEEKKVKDREGAISTQEDKVSRGEEEISKLKAEAEMLGPKTAEGKAKKTEIAAKQATVNTEKEKLRTLKKGTGEKVVTGRDAAGNPTTRAMTMADVGKTLEILKRDGSTTSEEVSGDMFEGSRGLDKMQKNLEAIKTARLKAFHLSLMQENGRSVHGTKTDEIGNITDAGHMAHENTRQTGERIGRNLYRDLGKNIMKGVHAGAAGAAAGGLVAGPFGAGIGAAGGFASGFLSHSIVTAAGPQIGDLDHDAAHHSTSTEKHEHAHFKDTYKSPSSGFFDMFKGLGTSSGGGGGGGDHGGGHDDHGGGHAH